MIICYWLVKRVLEVLTCLVSSQVPFPTSSSFTQEVETALESFDFLNCSDLEEEEEEEVEEEGEEEQEQAEHQEEVVQKEMDELHEDNEQPTEEEHQEEDEQQKEEEPQEEPKGAKQEGEEQPGEDQNKSEQDIIDEEKAEEEEEEEEETKEILDSGARFVFSFEYSQEWQSPSANSENWRVINKKVCNCQKRAQKHFSFFL